MMMSASIFPPAMEMPQAFISSFAALAQSTQAVPFEIPGVARYGQFPFGSDTVDPLPTLVSLEGSSNSASMPGLPHVARFNTALDTKWEQLLRGVNVKGVIAQHPYFDGDREIIRFLNLRDTISIDLVGGWGDKTPRQIIEQESDEDQSALRDLAQLSAAAARAVQGDRAEDLAFVSGMFMACSKALSHERDFDFFLDSLGVIKGFFSRQDELATFMNYKASGAIAAEAYADALRSRRGPKGLEAELRGRAAIEWSSYLVLQTNFQHLKKADVVIAVYRALNAGQHDHIGTNLESIVSSFMPAPTFEERVKNLIRGAWFLILEESSVGAPEYGIFFRWEGISDLLYEASGMLQGNYSYYSPDDFAAAFAGMSKAAMAGSLEELADEALTMTRGIRENYVDPDALPDEFSKDEAEEYLRDVKKQEATGASKAPPKIVPPWAPTYE